MKKICPNCGKEVDPEAKYCPFCHFNLVNNEETIVTIDVGLLGRREVSGSDEESDKPPEKEESATETATPPSKPKSPKQVKPAEQSLAKSPSKPKTEESKLKKSKKTDPVPPAHATSLLKNKKHFNIWPIVSAVAILLVAVLVMGSTSFYSRKQQVNRIETAIKNDKVSHLVAADKQKITAKKLKPLSDYYKKNPKAYKKLKKDLMGKNDGPIRLIQDGHYLGLFPRYVVQLPTYKLQVKNDYQHTAVTVNGEHFDQAAQVLPGRYKIKAETSYLGQTAKDEKTVDVWSDQESKVKLNVGSFKVKSAPNAKDYLNNKLAAQLDGKGEKTFTDMPLTKDFSLYVAKNSNGKLVKSKMIANATAIVRKHNNHVFDLTWGSSSVKALLEKNFNKLNAKDFINGKKNPNYAQLKKIVRTWKKTPSLTSYKVKVKQHNKNLKSLNYSVTFDFKFNMGGTSRQVMKFTNASIKKSQAGLKIDSIGSGRLLGAR